MSEQALRVAVIGCGNISGAYGETMSAYPTVRIAGATDVDRALSEAFVDRFGGVHYPSLDDVLGDPAVDAIVNLTYPGVHAEVTNAALVAGKHVHSEKPLAGDYPSARSLVDLADDRGLRLSCSPITFLGEAQETMWRLVDEGAIGAVRVAYAEVNWSRIESWHPRPEPFYRIGPFADVGVYPLTILTAMFGPARRVTAFGKVLYPDRTTTSGEPFSPGAPDFGVAVIELESGTVVRLTANFYVGHHSKQSGIELHGDTGSLFLSSWQEFDATVELAPFGGSYEPVPVENPFRGTDWGRALGELSDAIVTGRPHRATGAHAAHIVEILDATTTSATEGRAVEVTSSFPRPALRPGSPLQP
ncbi:MAG TPA: Gfo/Idh/MocA family oxidoreductase [Gaiellaceae bacterium]|nr:Gfo/Idh/MocA family oxidoreductase [Gaiellaceae bacterium]